MQPGLNSQDPLRVTRRPLDPEDAVDIARRNIGAVAGPALAGLVLGVVIAFLWPDTYVSSAVIRVVPPMIPQKFIPTNVNTNIGDRVGAMAQTITSRATLISIIETYGLYPRERAKMPLEDVASIMRSSISIGNVRSMQRSSRDESFTAFQIAFRYENRYMAQKVTQDLVGRFINENQRQRASQSATTTQFLKEQWQAAKNELDSIEQRVTEFRVKHEGRLPDQWNSSAQKLGLLEARVTSLNGTITRLEQEKLILNSERNLVRDRLDGIMSAKPTETGGVYVDPRLAALDQRIREAELALARTLENYKPTHPDVARQRGQIDVLTREREEYLKNRTETAARPELARLSPEQAKEVRDLNNRLNSMQIQEQGKDLQIAEAQKEIGQLTRQADDLRQSLRLAPVDSQEYIGLLRDYEMAKRTYNDFNSKMQQSELATDLENRQQGETLETLDNASLPDTPAQPQRFTIIMMGLGVGVTIGGMLVFGREIKDTSLKTLKDVRAYSKLPVLGSVPLLENDVVVLRRKRMAWLGWSAACLFSAVIMAGAVYYYYAHKV